MPSVDCSNPSTSATETSLPRAISGHNRQTWLKALEDASLRDALRATRQFIASGAPSPLPESSQSHAQFARRDSDGRFADEEPLPAGPQNLNSESGGSSRTTDSGCAPGIRSTASAWQAVNAAAEPLRPATASDISGHETGAAPTKSMLQLLTPPRIWLARNVAVLPSGEGVEVWIRDSAMAESGVVRMLAGLRDSMAELGTSLVRVSLNGKPVHSSAQAKPGERKSKEE